MRDTKKKSSLGESMDLLKFNPPKMHISSLLIKASAVNGNSFWLRTILPFDEGS
jgi:hypothetical protein